MAKRAPDIGDYVLATKFDHGDPCDPFCLGFVSAILNPRYSGDGRRYVVVDNNGAPFLANGFRRAERITTKTGDALFAIFPIIGDKPGHSVWWWRRNLKAARELAKREAVK